jgi:hypothetical protein
MNFTDFFTRGLANTLKFKNQANFSYRGTAVVISSATVVDKWYLQDFTTANYEITVEYGTDDVEHLNAVVTARANQASITVYGRTNLGRDLVKFTTTVDNSVVNLVATPFYTSSHPIGTPLTNVRVIFKVTYSERITRLTVPQTDGETSSLGGEPGLRLNWNNSNLPDGFLQITENGEIEITTLNAIGVAGQPTLQSAFILDSFNITNPDNAIAVTTNSSTRTLTFTAVNYPSVSVTSSFTNTLSGAGNTMNNTVIGGSTPLPAKFTTLMSTGQTNLTPVDSNVTISPTGTGRIVVNSSIPGTMNNVIVGSITPAGATFSTLLLTTPLNGGSDLATLDTVKQQLLLGAIK